MIFDINNFINVFFFDSILVTHTKIAITNDKVNTTIFVVESHIIVVAPHAIAACPLGENPSFIHLCFLLKLAAFNDTININVIDNSGYYEIIKDNNTQRNDIFKIQSSAIYY